MKRTPELLNTLDELDEATAQTEAMLSMLMLNFTNAASGEECLSDSSLANYVWALKAQNARVARAAETIGKATAPDAA